MPPIESWSDVTGDVTSVHEGEAKVLPPSWYELVSVQTLEQGDFFASCQVVLPAFGCPFPQPAHGPVPVIDAVVKVYDVVVLSQSCDLEQGKITHALVCPYESIKHLPRIVERPTMNAKDIKNALKNIRDGKEHGFHLLNSCDLPPFGFEPQLVSFRTVFSVPVVYLTHLAQAQHPRLRLRSPYKEQLSQAFARFFMRVGLPQDIKID
jgi:hypothetical protein